MFGKYASDAVFITVKALINGHSKRCTALINGKTLCQILIQKTPKERQAISG